LAWHTAKPWSADLARVLTRLTRNPIRSDWSQPRAATGAIMAATALCLPLSGLDARTGAARLL